MGDPLDQVMAAVAESRRYRNVCDATVQRLAREALAASGGEPREASKRTKRALQQIFGAYLPTPPPWQKLLERLDRAVASGDPLVLRATLRELMGRHASTRERLPLLDRFWAELGTRLGGQQRVLDVGSGLNPLSVPWWGLAPDGVCSGVEIDAQLVDFVRACLDRLGVKHDIRLEDVLDGMALPPADVALVLKLLPTLERQRAGSGQALLDALPAPHVVVSFPTRSLGRRAKGLEASYARDFEALLARRSWAAERIDLPGELVYLVRK